MSMSIAWLHNDTKDLKVSNSTIVTPLFAIFFASVDAILIITTVSFVLTIVATILAKSVNSVIRLLIINQLVACVLFLFSPLQFQSNSLVLSSLGDRRSAHLPPIGYCQFVSILLALGACGRSWSVVVFAVFVLVITVKGIKKVTVTQAMVAIVSLWVVTFAICAYILLPYPQFKLYPVQYFDNVLCGPSGDGISREVLLSTSLLWTFFAALLPLAIAIIIPIVTLCYIRPRIATGEQYYNKKIAKLSLFLVAGTVVNLIARAIPSIALSINNHVATYLVTGLLVSLSPIPTLFIVLWFVKSAREELCQMLTCRCKTKLSCPIAKKTRSCSMTTNIQSSSSNC